MSTQKEVMQPQKEVRKKPDLPIFRERLNEALKSHDISQRQLALKIDRDPRSVNHIFAGPVHPDLPTLKALAKELGVSVDWLLGITDDKVSKIQTGLTILRRFKTMNDIAFPERFLSMDTLNTNAFGDSQVVASVPVSTDNFSPLLEKDDILYVDMGYHDITTQGLYVCKWEGHGDNVYINLFNLTHIGGVVMMWPEGCQGRKMGNPTTQDIDREKIKVLGKVITKQTTRLFS